MELTRLRSALIVVVLVGSVRPLLLAGQDSSAIRTRHDSVLVHFVDVDLRAIIEAVSPYLPKPVIVGSIQPVRASLETPGPVSRPLLLSLLKGVVESQDLDFVED